VAVAVAVARARAVAVARARARARRAAKGPARKHGGEGRGGEGWGGRQLCVGRLAVAERRRDAEREAVEAEVNL